MPRIPLPSFLKTKRKPKDSLLISSEGSSPPSRDTLAAIDELSRVVKDNPDAIEIYLALGNLFRSEGEIERAIQIRNSLIVRPNLEPQFKARAWFELGRDYKRGGFMDRAQYALEQAHTILGDDPVLLEDLSRLAAENSDYENAAKYSALLGNKKAQAHYIVKLATLAAQQGDSAGEKKWLNKAFKIYPGSVEAWLRRLQGLFLSDDMNRLGKELDKALSIIPQKLRFVLLEGLIETQSALDRGNHPKDLVGGLQDKVQWSGGFCTTLLPVLEKQPQDLLVYFYGSSIAFKCGEIEVSKNWLEKTLLIEPNFWPARLELLHRTMDEQSLAPNFRVQLDFFLKRARRVKRFICQSCGLKREHLFFVCPRCHAWHSISFRLSLSD